VLVFGQPGLNWRAYLTVLLSITCTQANRHQLHPKNLEIHHLGAPRGDSIPQSVDVHELTGAQKALAAVFQN
jgi:hypothetical protein